MLSRFVILLAAAFLARAEVHTLTLRQAAEVAMRQAPDVLLARLERQKAEQNVRIARDPFFPKIYAGSGLAYSNGFPMSIEGSAPTIVQATATASVYNLEQKYKAAGARENARGAGLEEQTRQEGALFQAVRLFLETESLGRRAEAAGRQVASALRMQDLVQARVQEGRELTIELRRAELSLAQARQQVENLEGDLDYGESSLALVLGYPEGDKVHPAAEERSPAQLPLTADDAASQALDGNPKIRRIESALLASGFEVKANQAARYPRLDLVAQYGLFSRFNNYEDFFRKFQRHNGQVGVSIQIPILAGPAANAAASVAAAEASRLRLEMQTTRGQIRMEAERAFQQVHRAETARQVARLELDISRESLSLLLAQLDEGRATVGQVEQSRLEEAAKWQGFYESQYQLELAQYQLLDATGGLMAALR